MSKVKFNVNTEYMYIQNFKVLQSTRFPRARIKATVLTAISHLDTFAKHGMDKLVPVENLMKCKMQDNLEFLQYSKRYWDQYYPGGDYDAVARRKASGSVPTVGAGAPRAPVHSGARRAPGGGVAPRTRTPQGGPGSAALHQENSVLKETVAGLERERDFYFSKLRDIELLIQQAVDADPELDKEDNILKQIQAILYSTEVCQLAVTLPSHTESRTLTNICI
jgi:microtubule-associated protein, RP/EB family